MELLTIGQILTYGTATVLGVAGGIIMVFYDDDTGNGLDETVRKYLPWADLTGVIFWVVGCIIAANNYPSSPNGESHGFLLFMGLVSTSAACSIIAFLAVGAACALLGLSNRLKGT